MTIRRYFELSLFVPLAVPLLLALLGFGFGSEPGAFEPEFRSFQFGTAVLAVPYLGLAYYARRRMRRMSEPEIVKLSLEAPFLFAIVVWLCLLPILIGTMFSGNSSISQVAGMVAGVGLIALVVAGAYVVLIDGVLFVLYRAGLVRRETPAEA
ncbi:MAG TPA: hypothetical protein VFQ76_04520 [Longimicrobiaceae bacterium]|nr:hypothetical protein [Longimicrobiaceae bacterium]